MLFTFVYLITIFWFVSTCKIYIDIGTFFFLVNNISIKVYIDDSTRSESQYIQLSPNEDRDWFLQTRWIKSMSIMLSS